MKRFLIINPFGIGDVLFMTPVVRSIKLSGQDIFVGYWCNQRVRPVLENNPNIDKIFALSRGDLKRISRSSKIKALVSFLRLLRDIKKCSFDISLDFSLDHRYSLISKLAGIRRRVGPDFKKRNCFLTEKIETRGYSGRHVAEYYADILKLVGISKQGADLDIFLSDTEDTQAEALLRGLGIAHSDLVVGIAPGAGASWGERAGLKHWPARNFAELADRIIASFGAKIIILGDAGEKAIAQDMFRMMRNKALDLTGKTTLGQLCAVIKRLGLLITNDGGPLHIAVAEEVKTVSFFGPVDENAYGPYPSSERNIVLKSKLDCRPCYKNFRLTECLNSRKCLQDITVDQAYAAVKNLI